MNKLSAEQRHFFQQIADMAFINPFSEQRKQADCRLLAIQPEKLTLEQRIQQIQQRLSEQLTRLQPLDEFKVERYAGKLRRVMEFAWLFYQFHEFQNPFFQFIEQQQQAGDTPIALPFAKQLLGRFAAAGFDQAASEKYIGLFYQLHRGFYFINSMVSGHSLAIIELRMHLWNNIFTFNPHWYLDYLCGRMEEFSTLLLGPTGCGKSLVARAIGCSGFIPFDAKRLRFQESFTRSFQSINLAQFPSSLLEAELFGHKKGAFTGAIENHDGLFARCSPYGAVFIDEIGDIDIPTQVKLLNVVQDRVFYPVGSHEKQRFAGRVISATNRDIGQLRQQGLFRDDLFYRLCSDVIEVPGLQQRLEQNPDEISHLIGGLLARVISEPDQRLVQRIEDRIRSTIPAGYHWPGNVRELEQCIRQICLTGTYRISPASPQTPTTAFQIDREEVSARQLQQRYCRYLYDKHGSYEAVARISGLDRRTAKKYIQE
ncbi:MAG: sigma 54-interacting transcriptional regulator [Methylomonas sp.]|nr:sigma 54-interacting transcriptional regulator [Methylomonas sp.]